MVYLVDQLAHIGTPLENYYSKTCVLGNRKVPKNNSSNDRFL